MSGSFQDPGPAENKAAIVTLIVASQLLKLGGVRAN